MFLLKVTGIVKCFYINTTFIIWSVFCCFCLYCTQMWW